MKDRMIEVNVYEGVGPNLIFSWKGLEKDFPGALFEIFKALGTPLQSLGLFHG